MGTAKSIPSIRSNTPPWPGNKSPVSLTFALRFMNEIKRSPNWQKNDTRIANIIKSPGLLNLSSNKKWNIGTKNKDKTNEPIDPDIVLLGLIFVNFFPLKSLPNNKPPISEKTQTQIKNNVLILKSFWETPENTIPENIVRYNKLVAWIVNLKNLDLNFFWKKIFEIKPWNSIQEITEIIINEIIKMYE